MKLVPNLPNDELSAMDISVSNRHMKVSTTYQGSKNSFSEIETCTATLLAQSLKNSLSPVMSEICGTRVDGRLTAQFKNIVKYEEGEAGSRPLCLSRHGSCLGGFEFNTSAPYDHVFGAEYFIKTGSRRGHVILHFPSFVPAQTFERPENATNFKISARLVAISDFSYDEDAKKYVPVNPNYHGQYGEYKSSMLPLLKMSTEPMTTQLSISPLEIPEKMGVFLIMAVSFFHYENGRFEHLAADSAMSIKQVY